MSSSSVQVVVRLRPMNENEKKEGTLPVIKAKTQEKSVTVIKGQGPRQARSNFSFDNVFTAFSTQAEVFDATLKPMIRDVMQGYESTVFAYGQTGTGKTYTMEGNLTSPEHYGIIPRAAQSIFEALKKTEFVSYNVVCTYLEIYNEDLCDLLSDDPGVPATSSSSSTPMKDKNNTTHNSKKLEIMNGKSGTFCRGLTEREVRSASDVLVLMQGAQQLRRIGETKMNKESSRSHCVFSIIINANKRLNDGSTFEFKGKLHMVDLAGSECAKTAALDKASGNEVARDRERMNINRSLLTLGRVIKTLKDQSNSTKNKNSNVRIPYRDSKLTRILQESLGGRCKTLIIATLSPSITAIEESVSTLNYAQAANGIVNKPVSSAYLSLGSSASCSMESSGSSEPNTVEHWQEMECRLEYMQTQVEEAKAALARKHMQQQELLERAEKAENDVAELENKHFLATEEVKRLQKEVAKEQDEKQTITALLQEAELSLKTTNAILEATQHTEVCLTSEALKILMSLEDSIKDGDNLHQLLSKARENDVNTRNATKRFHGTTVSILIGIVNQLNDLRTKTKSYQKSIEGHIKNDESRREETMSSFEVVLNEVNLKINSLVCDIESLAMGENGSKQVLDEALYKSTQLIEATDALAFADEKNLKKRIRGTLCKISHSSDNLKKRNDDYIKYTDAFLNTFEGHVNLAKDQLSNMISNASKSLTRISDASKDTRNIILTLLNQIQATSETTSSSVKEILNVQIDEMNAALDIFSKGKENIEDMTYRLGEQKSLLNDQGGAHLKEINDLKKVIEDQKCMFNQACTEQQRLHDEAMGNMFLGMQQLVQTEMQRLSNLNQNLQQSLKSTNQNMLSLNGNIRSSASEIIGRVDDTNGNLLKQVNFVQVNNESVEKIIKKLKGTSTKIEDAAVSGQKATTSHLEGALGEITKIETLEGDITQLGEQILNDNKSITGIIDEKLRSDSKQGIKQITQKAEENMDYTLNTVMSSIVVELDEIRAPREKVVKDISSNLHEIKSCIENASNEISLRLEEQGTKSGIIRDTIDTNGQVYKELWRNHCDDANTRNQDLASSTSKFETSSSSMISSCQSSLSNAQKTVNDFSVSDIHAEESVPPLISRTKIEYSSKFTSTPSAEVILKDLNINDNEDSNDSVSVRSETSNISSAGKSVIQDPSPSSENSNAVMDRKPSPLGDLSVNKENIDSMQPFGKSKKRSNSRLRGHGNRIPTTPSRSGMSKRRKDA